MNTAREESREPALRAVEEGPGVRLRQARENKGLSLRAAADELHLPTSMVEALERDDYEYLPVPTFVRGYIRNYARLLGLSEDELIELYEQASGTGAFAEGALPRQHSAEKDRGEAWVRRSTYLVVLVILVLVGLWWQNREAEQAEPTVAGEDSATPPAEQQTTADEPAGAAPQAEEPSAMASGSETDEAGQAEEPSAVEPQAPAQPGSAPSIEVPGPGLAPPDMVAEMTQPSEQGAAEPAGQGPAAAQQESDEASESVEGPESPSDESGGGPAASAREPTEDGGQAQTLASASEAAETSAAATEGGDAGSGQLTEIILHFEDSSWVELSDARGERLMFDLGRSGETRRYQGKLPFELLLGNAPAVRIEIDGEPYDHTPSIGPSNVANFTIDAQREE